MSLTHSDPFLSQKMVQQEEPFLSSVIGTGETTTVLGPPFSASGEAAELVAGEALACALAPGEDLVA